MSAAPTLNLLQFGRSGQLGRALTALAGPGIEITALDRGAADLADPAACAAAVTAARPDLVVIAAAYTQVDQAETEEETALRINAAAPGAIGAAARSAGAPVIHVSTDYVFDGRGGAPYAEDAPVAPLGAYGRTKLAGEAALLAAQPASLVLRTSWVFDAAGRNFLTSMLRHGAARDLLRVVDDQIGAPTPAAGLAAAILTAAPRLAADPDDPALRGLFHFQGAPHASWADFAEAVFDAAEPFWGRRPTVERIPSAEYPTPAPRPLDTRLDCARFTKTFDVERPDWRAAVQAGVKQALGAS